MANLKIGDFRNMTDAELHQSALKLKEELYVMCCNQQMGRLEKPDRMRLSKKNIARINTILKERKLEKR